MANSNFLVFGESVAASDIEADSVYQTDTQRINGVVPGIAEPALHNKLYKQVSIMAAAMAQVIVQAGFDALDSDYSKLVANMRHTFAGSVNNIKPDEKGNIDLTELVKTLKAFATPEVGEIILTKSSTNPAEKYAGTTWELLKEETFLMSAVKTVAAGATGGSNTHTNTKAEMPVHDHKVTCSTNGYHDHGRGSMNITGHLMLPTHTGRWNGNVYGAFANEGTNSNIEGADFNESSKWHDITPANFDASRSWSGRTSWEGGHGHTVTVKSTGEGKAWDCRPQYLAVYMWVRTA